jgi:hypothetical protein
MIGSHLYEISRIGKSVEIADWWFPGSRGRRKWEQVLKEWGFLGGCWKCFELDEDDHSRTL